MLPPPPPTVAATAISLREEDHHMPPSATTNPLFVTQNPTAAADDESSSVIAIQDGVNLDRSATSDGHIAITIGNAPPLLIPNHKFYNLRGILHLMYTVVLVVMYPSLAQLTQIKFQNQQQSPFESHSFLANTSVVAYAIAILSSVVLFYLITQLETSTKERTSPIYYIYVILKSVFYFSSILAPLSLLLLLLLPHKFIWIGYIIIFILFVVIVVCNISDYRKLFYKKEGSNQQDVQIN